MFRLTQLKYETILLFNLFIGNLIINAASNSQYTAIRDYESEGTQKEATVA